MFHQYLNGFVSTCCFNELDIQTKCGCFHRLIHEHADFFLPGFRRHGRSFIDEFVFLTTVTQMSPHPPAAALRVSLSPLLLCSLFVCISSRSGSHAEAHADGKTRWNQSEGVFYFRSEMIICSWVTQTHKLKQHVFSEISLKNQRWFMEDEEVQSIFVYFWVWSSKLTHSNTCNPTASAWVTVQIT